MLVRPGTQPFEAFNYPGGVDAFYAAEKSAIDALPPPEPPAWPEGDAKGLANGMSWHDATLAELGFSPKPGVGSAYAKLERANIAMAERVAKQARVFFREGEFLTDDVPEPKLALDGTRLAMLMTGIAWCGARRRTTQSVDA